MFNLNPQKILASNILRLFNNIIYHREFCRIEHSTSLGLKKRYQANIKFNEYVKEMGVQDAIKHIKEENKNDDNLKAYRYICHELSLKSPRYNSNAMNKKKSATKRLQNWIQYDKYPSLTLEQAEKLVIMLNSGSKVLVDGDKISMRGNDLVTLKKQDWLNDEVINFYIELILKSSASEPEKYPKIHMFNVFNVNTFFYLTLEKKRYSNVSMLTKKAKVDIFSRHIYRFCGHQY